MLLQFQDLPVKICNKLGLIISHISEKLNQVGFG